MRCQYAKICTTARCILLCLPWLLQWPVPGHAKSDLLVAVAPLAPWQWMQAGQGRGPDVEFLELLAKRLDFSPQWVPLAAADNLAPLQEGRAEIVAGIADTVDQRNVLQCFRTPHRMQGALHIYVRKGAEHFLQFETDLTQYRTGLADGVRLPAVESAPRARIPRGQLADLLPALASGAIDALAAEAVAWERHRPALPGNVVKAPLEISAMPLFVCLSRAAPLVVRFDEIELLYQDLVE